MNADILGGGFTDTSRDAAIAFRATLDALSRPGTIVSVAGAIPPAPLSIAAGVVIGASRGDGRLDTGVLAELMAAVSPRPVP